MSSKIKVDTIENVAGSGNVSLGSGHNLVVPGNITGQGTAAITSNATVGGTLGVTGAMTGTTQTLNRSGNGVIQTFQKDGSTIGEISGTIGLIVGTGDTGLGFQTSTGDAIIPQRPDTQAGADNLLSFGNTSYRFKDMYLGGGLYVGGTGAANHLDDYEEGSFVPILKHEVGDALTVGYASGFTHGRYVKIGRLVTFQLTIDVDSVSGGASNQQLVVPNLPFTSKTYQTNSNGGANMTYMLNLNTNITYGIVLGNSTTLRFYSAPSTPSYGNTVTSSTHLQCYGQYETDA